MAEKLDWDDISLVPETISYIDSRSEINIYDKYGNLPLFTAPMDMVIDETNSDIFRENKINVCLPRGVKSKNENDFISFGLDEIIEKVENNEELPKRVLIDIANGHMKKLMDISKTIKEKYDVELMVGNIANPRTYLEYAKIGVDFIRCSIGSGAGCTTSANGAVHYPAASLINECFKIKEASNFKTKIVADGGFKKFPDIIKALALGADYVMLGGIFNKALESCSPCFLKSNGIKGIEYRKIDLDTAKLHLERGDIVYKYYRGMSTKEVQRDWGVSESNLRTSEGISFYNEVEYTLDGWLDNFSSYLKSAMSYTNSKNLELFKGVEFIVISQNAFNRFNK